MRNFVVTFLVLVSNLALAEFQAVQKVITVKTVADAPLRAYKSHLKLNQLPILCTVVANQELTIVGSDEAYGEGMMVVRVPHNLTFFGCPDTALVPESSLFDGEGSSDEKERPRVMPEVASSKPPMQSTEGTIPCRTCAISGSRASSVERIPSPPEAAQSAPSTGRVTNDPVSQYSKSEAVQKMISSALRNKRPDSTGYCYRYVKYALLRSDLVDGYLTGVSASNAGRRLKQQGFSNLLEDSKWANKINDPSDAPKGAVLVYSGGPDGHIEIKTGDGKQGGYVSDYFSDEPRTGFKMAGRDRRLIGVYVKRGVK